MKGKIGDGYNRINLKISKNNINTKKVHLKHFSNKKPCMKHSPEKSYLFLLK